jgi:hypothetical protein
VRDRGQVQATGPTGQVEEDRATSAREGVDIVAVLGDREPFQIGAKARATAPPMSPPPP